MASGTLGIENVNINVYDLDNNGVGWANTDENGYYTVNGIPAGNKKSRIQYRQCSRKLPRRMVQ